MTPSEALKRAVVGCKRALVAVTLFSLGINMLMLTVPIFMMQMYDRVVPARSTDTLLLLILMALGALVVMALLEGTRGRIMVRLGTWLDKELSGVILSGSMADSLRTGKTRGAGGLRELNQVRAFVTGPGIFPLLDAPWVPIFVGIIFLLHPMLGWIAVGGAVIILGFAVVNDFATRKRLQEANAAAGRALYRADAVVRNADVVAAMGMMPDLVRRWQDGNRSGLDLQAEASDRGGTISSAAKAFRLFLQILMLSVGAWLVMQAELTGGGMIAASIILTRAMAPVEQSISAWRGLVQAKSGYAQIKELLDRAPAGNEGMSLPRPSGELTVETVTFVPPGSKEPVVRGVSFGLRPGESMGLIGSSASGKTTLARLLVGSWTPTAGHVRLDGMDVAVWEAVDRGRHVGYLPQDVELFDGTVKENIARLREATSEEVVAAATLAGVHELILRLPEGYDTPIGEGGIMLSGGQRQRVALARAVFGGPRLVVLDEPNSSLDTEGERALMQALRALKAAGTTIIVIAHRPAILAHVDKLLVMQGGRVEMFGPRDEVMEKVAPGRAAQLHRASQTPPGQAASLASPGQSPAPPRASGAERVPGAGMPRIVAGPRPVAGPVADAPTGKDAGGLPPAAVQGARRPQE